MSAEGVHDPNASEQVGSDTPMESFDKGKGKAPADDAMEEDDSSEDDEEVSIPISAHSWQIANSNAERRRR